MMSESNIIKAVIVDDEENNCLHLKQQVSRLSDEIKIVAMAGSAAEGVELIKRHQPDLVFLDIQMPEGSGFDMLKALPENHFKVIFVTAYDQYAIKAIRYCAFDYLLKPINALELNRTLERAVKAIQSDIHNSELQRTELLNNKRTELTRIALPSAQRLLFVEVKDIVRCEAESNYTHVFLASGKQELVSRTLKEFEELLSENGFIRVHQSHLVNLSHIGSYEKAEGGFLLMNDQAQVPISRLRKDTVMSLLNT